MFPWKCVIVQLIFIYLFYILQRYWNHWLVIAGFLDSLRFSTYNILSLQIIKWMSFTSFSSLMALVKFKLCRTALRRRQWHPNSSTLAWKIPWTEELGRLQSMGSQRVGHDWATSLSLSCIGAGNGNPLQCFCLGNPRDGGACWAAV